MSIIHTEHFDYICALGRNTQLAEYFKALQYSPITTAVSDIPAHRDGLAEWANSQSRVGITGVQKFFPPSTEPGRTLLLYLSGFDDAVECADTDDLDAFSSTIEQLYPELDFRVLLLSPKSGMRPSHPRLTRISLPAGASHRAYILRHIEKVIENQPAMVKALAGKRGPVDKGEYNAPKIRLGRPQDMPKHTSAEFTINRHGVDFEFYGRLRGNDVPLVVFGQSAITRPASKPPVFHRWSWVDDLPYSCLVLNDPTLYLSDVMEGGWFQGTEDHFYMETAAELIRDIAGSSGIEPNKILFFGSSAGGFTSMQMATMVKGSHALVQIPQVDMSDYHVAAAVDHLLAYCYGGKSLSEATTLYPDRWSALETFRKYKHIPNIWYLQNSHDTNHLKRHFAKFVSGVCELMVEFPSLRDTQVLTEFYSINHPVRGGHTVLGKDETLKLIDRAIARFIGDAA
ncbi:MULTISPECIES: hypothetical protein [Achromobacter]|uniref:Peptidase S9 prolyl oligopeptidase catalytic domain-containing protein n=1 Tax=Achromobacter spanius TaxID=217203 RepID=A0ABY8GRU6_9BURK|nr:MULTISPECIES: hypothetical protein [Achromobacter]WAI83183.1 hypothetical protein N8Z00_27435 [Achromobacter spanius]WEX93268.1 hypothetical protein N3Z32_22030 [Achromobacter sp. SS2-2022]WFP07574.1 hypothetical protein P8T11_25220 [Achromobacter spanius]